MTRISVGDYDTWKPDVALVALRGREDEPPLQGLLSVLGPVHAPEDGILIGWEEDGAVAACASVCRRGETMELRGIATAVEIDGRRVKHALVDALARTVDATTLVAETDLDRPHALAVPGRGGALEA